jgi:glycosyltransferase involved in cell wall biosynthesis
MKIAILAPSHKSFISPLLSPIDIDDLPDGYNGAPFIGILINELLSLGHEVVAITTSELIDNDWEVKEFSNDKFKWIVVPARKNSFRFNAGKLGRIIDFFALERKLMKKVVCDQKPDFIHAHWSYEFAGAALQTNLPCLITVHDNAYQIAKYFKNAYRLGRLLMSEWILRKVRYASTVSPYMASYVKSRCKKVLVIPNPVLIDCTSTEVATQINRKSIGIKTPRIVMIFNGWDERKNGKVGLQAYALIKAEFPEASLHLYGNGTAVGGLAHQDCKNLAIKDVFFHGSVAHHVLLKEISKAHVLLHTSLEESFGVVLIEAMSQGIPAIGGEKSGAVPWVIDNSDLLVDVSNPLAIKNKIIHLFNSQESYEKIALECYNNTLSRFSDKVIVQQYLSYYNDILKEW